MRSDDRRFNPFASAMIRNMTSVPAIYSHNNALPRLGWGPRTLAGVCAAICLAVLILAASLTPNSAGVETHRQLGLPPCGLLRMTGVPCMTCGMTTSFSELAHGNIWRSLVAQPAGTVLALCTAMAFCIGSYIAATGRPSARLLDLFPITRVLFTLLGIVLAGWTYKIFALVGKAP